MSALWEEMLDEFRALGGVAANVCLGEGRFGRGLFPCNPSKPVKLHIPEALLVEVKYIRFEGDVFRLHNSAPVDPRQRAFLENYQRDFSWGGGRGETETLLQLMHDAPQELQAFLKAPLGADLWLSGPTPEAVRERYFSTRYITYKGRGVLMPIVELANHGRLCLYDRENGVGISGLFDGEILARYCFSDAWDIFSNWGFASEEQLFALSLPMTLEAQDGALIIERGDVSTEPGREHFFPDVSNENGRLKLSYMLLGHRDHPELARAHFQRIMRETGRSDADAVFGRIQSFNRMAFRKLTEISESAPPALGNILRSAARVQLEALSCDAASSC